MRLTIISSSAVCLYCVVHSKEPLLHQECDEYCFCSPLDGKNSSLFIIPTTRLFNYISDNINFVNGFLLS